MGKKLINWIIFVCVSLMVFWCAYAIGEGSQQSIKLNEAELSIVKGKSFKLVPYTENIANPKKVKYSWSSSDTTVATVNNGLVKAVDGGSAVITCNCLLEDGSLILVSAKVIVIVPAKSLKLLSDKSITLNVGSVSTVSYEISPINTTDKTVVWTSSDSSIASVDENGVITAEKAGKATISGTTRDGSNKKIQVSIYVPSLYCSTNTVNLDQTNGKDIDINFYGSNWNQDISISQKGNVFNYFISGSGTNRRIRFMPVTEGSGSLTIINKKDSKSRITINVTVTHVEISPVQYVLFKYVTCNEGFIDLSFQNNCDEDIAGISFYVISYDKFDNIVYVNSSIEEMEPRFINYHDIIKSGDTVSYDSDFVDPKVDHVDIAVEQILLGNGASIIIADSDKYWYSSQKHGYKGAPRAEARNVFPDSVTFEKEGKVKLGWKSIIVREWDAEHYGFHHDGAYVYEVSAGSLAEKAGLRVGDLVVSVDGVSFNDDSYYMIRGKAKVADGESVVLSIERGNEEKTIDLVLKQ